MSGCAAWSCFVPTSHLGKREIERDHLGLFLDAYRGVAIPVQNGKLYRARFRGFDATAANTTCSRLKTMQIDCFVTKTE